MCGSRDGFFYNYSELATKEYKEELENIVTTYDGFNDAKTYTPYAASLIALVIAGVKTALGDNPSYNLTFNLLLLVVPAVQAGIMAIANTGAGNFAQKGNRLIETGVKLKFFKDAPEPLPINASDEVEIAIPHDIRSDALKYRLLNR